MEFLHQYFSEELIYALGWTVLHSLWQGLLVALIMALCFQALRQKSARIRYEIAGISLFAVFIMALSTFIILYDSVEQHTLEAILTGEFTLLINIGADGGFIQETIQQGMDYFNQYLPLIVVVWLMGSVFFSLRLLGGLAFVQHLKYNDNQLLPAFWQKQMDQLSAKLRLRKKVDLLESGLVSVPMVIGFFKPAILMPIGAINTLSEAEVEAILAHELAHILRNDYLLNILFSFIEVLFYYHPAVWWISANLRVERENCCDDIAVKLCGNSLTYAKALVSLQEMNRQQTIPQFAMPFFGEKQHLLNRIKRILNQPQNRSNIMEKMTATCLLLFGLTFFSINAKTPINQQSSNLFHLWDSIELTDLKTKEELKAKELAQQKAMMQRLMARAEASRTDTIPSRKKDRQRIIKEENGQRIEMILEDNEVVELIIDGQKTAPEDLDQHEALIANMVEEFSQIPSPPSPPAPPSPPSPPNPPSTTGFGATFPPVPMEATTITTTKGANGETIIIVEGENEEPMEIVVESDQNVISIDGNTITTGDTAFIYEQNNGIIRFQQDDLFPSDIIVTKDDIRLFPQFAPENWEDDELKEMMEELAVQRKELSEEHRLRMKKWKKDMALKQKKSQAEIKELMKKRRIEIAKLNEEMKEVQREYHEQRQEALRAQSEERRQLLEEAHERFQKNDRLNHASIHQIEEDRRELHTDVSFDRKGHFDTATRQAFEAQMLEDGLIDESFNYKMEISGKQLKINGKKQSAETLEQYKQLYTSLTGFTLSDKSKIKIKSKK